MVGTCFNFSAYIYDDFINRKCCMFIEIGNMLNFDLRDQPRHVLKQLKISI